jgi:hypothetical protein
MIEIMRTPVSFAMVPLAKFCGLTAFAATKLCWRPVDAFKTSKVSAVWAAKDLHVSSH